MSWKHCDTDESKLSLHDCRADRVILEDGTLSL